MNSIIIDGNWPSSSGSDLIPKQAKSVGRGLLPLLPMVLTKLTYFYVILVLHFYWLLHCPKKIYSSLINPAIFSVILFCSTNFIPMSMMHTAYIRSTNNRHKHDFILTFSTDKSQALRSISFSNKISAFIIKFKDHTSVPSICNFYVPPFSKAVFPIWEIPRRISLNTNSRISTRVSLPCFWQFRGSMHVRVAIVDT